MRRAAEARPVALAIGGQVERSNLEGADGDAAAHLGGGVLEGGGGGAKQPGGRVGDHVDRPYSKNCFIRTPPGRSRLHVLSWSATNHSC